MANAVSTPAPGATASGHKTKAQPASGKTALDRVEAKAKANVREAGQDIARHLHDLEKTTAKHVARAKREMKADTAKIKKAAVALGGKFKKNMKRAGNGRP